MAKQKYADPKDTICLTTVCRISYPHLFKMQAGFKENDKPTRNATLLFDKKTAERSPLYLAMEKCAKNAMVFGFGADKTRWPDGYKWPIRDGDKKKDAPKGYAGHWYVKATSTKTIPIVDRDMNPITEENESEIYGGCWVRAKIMASNFSVNGGNGVKFYLLGVQKIRDDEPFGTVRDGTDLFGAAIDEDYAAEQPEASEDVDGLEGFDFG